MSSILYTEFYSRVTGYSTQNHLGLALLVTDIYQNYLEYLEYLFCYTVAQK